MNKFFKRICDNLNLYFRHSLRIEKLIAIISIINYLSIFSRLKQTVANFLLIAIYIPLVGQLAQPIIINAQTVTLAQANACAIQSDGKIIAAGTAVENDINQFYVSRYTTTGAVDTSYNSTGSIITEIGTNAQVFGLIIQPADGKGVVVGYAVQGSNTEVAIARYTTTGILDSTFNSTGPIQGIVTTTVGAGATAAAIAIDASNNLVVAGVTSQSGSQQFLVIRYTSNGSQDSTFGNAGIVTTSINNSASASAIAIQSDGKIVVGGFSSDGINGNQFTLVRYNTDGSLDTANFGTNGIVTTVIGSQSQINSIAIQSNGAIVAGGTSDSDFAIARYNTNGSLDTTFNGTGIFTASLNNNNNNVVNEVVIQSDGKIVAGGLSGNFVALARFNINGTLDTTFGTNGVVTSMLHQSAGINDIAIQTDGKIVAAGFDDNRAAIARFTTTGALDTTFANNGILNSLTVPVTLDGEIIFNAFSMTKNATVNPDTNFNNIYTTSGVLFPMRVWSLHPSGVTQEAITLLFQIPENFDTILPVQVELHLIIANKSGTGNNAAVILRGDFKGNNAQFGAGAGGAEQTITSSTITFTEPTSTTLKHELLVIPLSNSSIMPGDIALLAFTRTAPTGTEYSADIYLSSLSFRYKKFD